MATPITVPPFFYSLCWFVIPTAPPCGGCWFMHSGPFRCSTWSKQCISICPITFTAIGFPAILTNVEIHSSAYGRKGGRPPSLPRGAGRRRMSAPRGKVFRGRWYISLRALSRQLVYWAQSQASWPLQCICTTSTIKRSEPSAATDG